MWWNKYIGLPFLEKGRDEEGVDCWGLARLIYKNERNILLPSYEECYEKTSDREILSKVINEERHSKWSEPATGMEFDIIILKMLGLPMHIGIVTKQNHMIHCSKDIGTVHENFASMKWQKKIMGFARYE
jgi:cell wall-associated NlpC family hydrolase